MIIGFSGLKGSGKSTAAGFLVEDGFTKMSFAEPIKRMLACIRLSPRDLYGDKKEESSEMLDGKTPRYAMQTLGTEWGRDLISPNIWVNVVKHDILKTKGDVVIDDCRFPNEVAMILGLEGIIVYIDRGGESGDHASEREVKSLHRHYTALNEGSQEDLYLTIKRVIEAARELKRIVKCMQT